MFEVDGICYAGTPTVQRRIIDASPLEGGMVLVKFASGEARLFDSTDIQGGAFAPVRDGSAHKTVTARRGFLTWLDGEIDISPEYVYEHSFEYDQAPQELMAI